MAVAKCTNENCKKKKRCYRYLAEPVKYQWYSNFDEKDCQFFIETLKRNLKNDRKIVK